MDELVASAVAHWGPRFTTNGVTTADFTRITAGIDHWDDWCRTWTAEGAAHEALGREALTEGRTRSAGEHLARAAVYHHFASSSSLPTSIRCQQPTERAVACLHRCPAHLGARWATGLERSPSRGSASSPSSVHPAGIRPPHRRAGA